MSNSKRTLQYSEKWARMQGRHQTGGDKGGSHIRGTVTAFVGEPTTLGQKRDGKYILCHQRGSIDYFG
jgi:hypothetical protein